MSRTSIILNCKNPKEAENTIQNILASKNYNPKEKDGEHFYQNGSGFLTGKKFIAYSLNENELTLEGWVRNFAIGGESKLSGVVGLIPKKQCKKVLNSIVDSIDSDSNSIQNAVVDNDRRTFLQKLIYKYDSKTNELRYSKTKIISLIWFILIFLWAMSLFMADMSSYSFGGAILVSLIEALILTLPVYVIGYVIGYFLNR